jgi:uncharacterized protein DUF2188
MSQDDRMVFRRSDGTWVNQRNGASRAGSVHDTQAEAAAAAHAMLENAGGGELTIKGRDGQIRSKDTVAPGNDPRSIRDTEH